MILNSYDNETVQYAQTILLHNGFLSHFFIIGNVYEKLRWRKRFLIKIFLQKSLYDYNLLIIWLKYKTFPILFVWKTHIEGTKSVITSVLQCKGVNVQFTVVPLKPLFDRYGGRYCRFLCSKVFNPYNFYIFSCSRNTQVTF